MTEVRCEGVPAREMKAVMTLGNGEWALLGPDPIMVVGYEDANDTVIVVRHAQDGVVIDHVDSAAPVVPIEAPERITLRWKHGK